MTISSVNQGSTKPQTKPKQRPTVVDPVPNWRNSITSKPGLRQNPTGPGISDHKGLDVGAPMGTPIQAAKDGKVVFAGDGGGYGNLVVLQHADGTFSKYAHQSKLNVQVGQDVKAGDVIGAVGSTGNSTGPHLHFEVRKGSPDGEVLDPVAFLEGAEQIAASSPASGYSAVSDSRGSSTGGGYSSSLGLPSGGSGSARAAGPSTASGPASSPGFSGNLSGISSGGVDGMWAQLAQYGITEDWLRKLLEELGVPESEMKQMMALVLGVIKQESGGSQSARSPVGATGLMQLMPATAQGLGVNPGDPKDNVRGGVTYLLQQLKAFGNDVPKALAAYNAGPGNVQKYGGIPPSLRRRSTSATSLRALGLPRWRLRVELPYDICRQETAEAARPRVPPKRTRVDAWRAGGQARSVPPARRGRGLPRQQPTV